MTEVYLDGARLDIEDPAKKATIGELFGAIEKELAPNGRFISVIEADGRMIDDCKGSSALLSDFSQVKVVTASFQETALSGVALLREYFINIRENLASCVRDMRLGGTGGLLFYPVYEGLIEALKTIEAVGIMGGKASMDAFADDPTPRCMKLIGLIGELKDAKAVADTVRMADILEYEIAPVIVELDHTLAPPAARA